MQKERAGITAPATGEAAQKHFKSIINSSRLTDAPGRKCNIATVHTYSNRKHTPLCPQLKYMHTEHKGNRMWRFQISEAWKSS